MALRQLSIYGDVKKNNDDIMLAIYGRFRATQKQDFGWMAHNVYFFFNKDLLFNKS